MATKKLQKSTLPGHPHSMQWLMAVLLIVAVAVTGLIIIRSSHASDGGWCDQYYLNHPGEARVGGSMCFFAIDDLSSRDPNKVETGVRLVQSVDPETLLSGAEGYYFDAAGYGGGTLIWGGPHRNVTGMNGKTLRACWYLRDTSGNAQVNMVMKSSSGVMAQDNQTVSGSGYNPYCISQNITQDSLNDLTFELRLLSGSVRANRMIATTTPTASNQPHTPSGGSTVAPLTVDVLHPTSTGANAAVVSQDGVNGNACNIQYGFKTNTNYRACILEPGHALNVFAGGYTAFAGRNINVCVGTFGVSPTVHFYRQNQPIVVGQTNSQPSTPIYAQTSTTAGTQGLAVFIACGKYTAVPSFDQIKLTAPQSTFITSVTVSQQ